MSVYVDQIIDYSAVVKGRVRRAGTHWCHMTADSLDELHEMAQKIGMKREWFQPRRFLHACHYDLVPSRRALAVRLGAVEVNSMQRMRDVKSAGLDRVEAAQ